jgi:hypothetical protein
MALYDGNRMIAGDDFDMCIGFDSPRKVTQIAVDFDRERRLRESGADIGRQACAADRAVEIADAAVRKCDRYHIHIPQSLRNCEERPCLTQGQLGFNLFDADIGQVRFL